MSLPPSPLPGITSPNALALARSLVDRSFAATESDAIDRLVQWAADEMRPGCGIFRRYPEADDIVSALLCYCSERVTVAVAAHVAAGR